MVSGARSLLCGASHGIREEEETAMGKIDVSRYVLEMEQVLHTEPDPVRCHNAIAVLLRWQFDDMLDDASRAKARMLVQEFESRHLQTAGPIPNIRHAPRARGWAS
jgi:hypothetical protein